MAGSIVHVSPPGPGLAARLPDFSAQRPSESIDDALARARAEARAEAMAEAARERVLLEEAFEVRLTVARRAVAGEAGSRLSAELAAALDAFFHDLDAEVARVLTPVLETAVRAKAMAAFAAATTRLMEGGIPVAEVCGPRDLLDALASELGQAGQALTLTETAGGELTVRAGRTRLATDFEGFAQTLLTLANDSGGPE